MLAPVVALVGFGWLLRARPPGKITFSGPFQPFIKRVQVLPARPIDVFDGFDTRVLVELDARGRLPAWWSKGFSSYYSTYGGQVARVKNGQLKSLGRGGTFDSPHLDFKSKKWVSEYRLNLRAIKPEAGQIRLRDTIKIQDSSQKPHATLWLDVPLRAPGIATKMPQISRVPAVKLESFVLDATPPIQSHDGQTRWRAKWKLLQNIPLAQAKTHPLSVNINVYIVNSRGERMGSVGTQSEGSTDLYSYPGGTSGAESDSRRHFIVGDYALDWPSVPGATKIPPREPLWLQGSIKSGDGWPLAVKIPIRDATGKNLFSPRNSPAPFRVLSVAQATPASDEKKDYGADSIVSVRVQSLKPMVDVSKWKWEADYSQHLRAANGQTLWELPFKGGKSPIGASYSWGGDLTQMEIRYFLVLGSVPASAGKVVFEAQIAADGSARVPVKIVVRP